MRAVCPGSFDPITHGHLDVINRAATLFGEVIVAVGRNSAKKYLFDTDERVELARAAVADPPAMILDEATSSIDTRTEAIVQAGMDKLMEGRTTFVIAHRLSTVRNSDAIICLDHGRIIERGNHDELIAKRGYYYQLYTGAFELE